MTHQEYEDLKNSFKRGNKILIWQVVFVVVFIGLLVYHLKK